MIRIVTDTAADIPLAEANSLAVELVKLNVNFGDMPFDVLAEDAFDVFYRLLESSKELPTTSQPAPTDYLQIFQSAKEAGDEVVVITLSSKLSGTLQSATIAKQMADYEPIYIIDSKQAAMGQRLLVEYAARLRDSGKTAAQIAGVIGDAAGRVCLFAALDTLKYLRRGGRIPRSAEVVGTLMGIRPLITVNSEGSVSMAGKARGHAGAVTGMVKLMDAHTNFDDAAPVYFGYTAQDQYCRNFAKLAAARYRLKNTPIVPVGPVVGTHVGPNAFAVAYLVKEKITP